MLHMQIAYAQQSTVTATNTTDAVFSQATYGTSHSIVLSCFFFLVIIC